MIVDVPAKRRVLTLCHLIVSSFFNPLCLRRFSRAFLHRRPDPAHHAGMGEMTASGCISHPAICIPATVAAFLDMVEFEFPGYLLYRMLDPPIFVAAASPLVHGVPVYHVCPGPLIKASDTLWAIRRGCLNKRIPLYLFGSSLGRRRKDYYCASAILKPHPVAPDVLFEILHVFLEHEVQRSIANSEPP